MDLLARRDHSEKEIRDKLAEKFSALEIEAAIEYARENRWLPEPKVMSDRYAGAMHRRNKGIRSINRKLKEKGLPAAVADGELELEKALRLAETKLYGRGPAEDGKPLDRAAREKIGRFLLARGFEPAIVRKVVYEKL